jgi:leucyl aminopeptidase
MTTPATLRYVTTDPDALADFQGRLAIVVPDTGKLDPTSRRVNRLTRGALERFVESDAFSSMGQGDARVLDYPTGLKATALVVIKLDQRSDAETQRRAGTHLLGDGKDAMVVFRNMRAISNLALGAVLKSYAFVDHKSGEEKERTTPTLTMMVPKPDEAENACADVGAIAEGVFFTRDLTNEPSNILTTTEFAERLIALSKLGVKVEVLEEKDLEKLGMRTLLAVGHGSPSPSKVVVMEWNGGKKGNKPFALIGKGVVFDTGGISLKPAGGMEDMTMDMGGAGVVSGVMKTLALRKAKANVVGIVGLVENMPDGLAQRPGDVVTSMKGDTVEVINTDAEGRLVLADVLWYAQDRFEPASMIDLATLTGAIIIGLGHDNAGVFSNNDSFCNRFLKAAGAEGEGAWRLPLGPAYDKLLKSQIADMKNVGGRAAGSITAAQFLQRFVKEDCPWIHLDIAGVASVKTATALAPKGATGWGVMALNRLIADTYES